MSSTANQILHSSLCCGCGVCSEKCPFNLIEMNYDPEGFLYPHLTNMEKCTHCHICERTCPVLNNDTIQISSHNISVYAGYFIHADERKRSASGGIATAISRKIISEGGKVCGVAYNEDFTKAGFQMAANLDELEKFRGSKYIQAVKGDIYTKVQATLENREKVLFIGLPCEIGALKNYLGKDFENLYTCELICYGPTSEKVARDFIGELKRKHTGKLTEFSVRYKKDGRWTPPYLRAVFENGEIFSRPFYETDYGHAFGIFPRISCYSCLYKGDRRVADITVGDYWGCTEKDKFWCAGGVSAIFVHTAKGKDLLTNLTEFQLVETTYEHASRANQMMFKRRDTHPGRDLFSELITTQGLHAACRHTKSLRSSCMKFAVKCIPASLKPLAVRLYAKL